MSFYSFLNALKNAHNAKMDALPKFADKCQIESYGKQGKMSLIILKRFRPTPLPYAYTKQGVKDAKDVKDSSNPSSSFVGYYMSDYIRECKLIVNEKKYNFVTEMTTPPDRIDIDIDLKFLKKYKIQGLLVVRA